MAINPETQYVGKIAPSDAEYPYGKARNITLPGDGTGTPWEAALVNDLFGLQQALLAKAGITPSGDPDTALASQYLQAFLQIVGLTAASIREITATGPVLETDQIIVIDATAGAVNLTLLASADAEAKLIKVQRSRSDPGTYACTIVPATAETIGGAASVALLPGEGYEFIPDGSTDYLQF